MVTKVFDVEKLDNDQEKRGDNGYNFVSDIPTNEVINNHVLLSLSCSRLSNCLTPFAWKIVYGNSKENKFNLGSKIMAPYKHWGRPL